MVALGVMVVNLVYCYQIEQSGYKDAEAKYNKIEGVIEEYKNEQLENEKTTIHTISNIYVATKEIVTILTYAYAVIYVERMVELSVTNKEEKEE